MCTVVSYPKLKLCLMGHMDISCRSSREIRILCKHTMPNIAVQINRDHKIHRKQSPAEYAGHLSVPLIRSLHMLSTLKSLHEYGIKRDLYTKRADTNFINSYPTSIAHRTLSIIFSDIYMFSGSILIKQGDVLIQRLDHNNKSWQWSRFTLSN